MSIFPSFFVEIFHANVCMFVFCSIIAFTLMVAVPPPSTPVQSVQFVQPIQ